VHARIDLYLRSHMFLFRSQGDCEMSCESKKEKYECCGKTFDTKEEMEAHKEKMHKKSGCGS